LKTNAARYWAKSDNLGVAAELMSGDIFCLAYFVESLEYHYYQYGDEQRGGMASFLLRSTPALENYVMHSTYLQLMEVAPIPVVIKGENHFAPLTPNAM